MTAREKTGTMTINRKSASRSGAQLTGHGRLERVIVAGVALMLGAFLTQTASTQTASRQPTPAAVLRCAPPAPGAPMFVTGDCVDPRFNDPYVDIDEQRNTLYPIAMFTADSKAPMPGSRSTFRHGNSTRDGSSRIPTSY